MSHTYHPSFGKLTPEEAAKFISQPLNGQQDMARRDIKKAATKRRAAETRAERLAEKAAARK